ncbi:MAG: F0F1 ATP synthase subunit delta [Gammaproteobacteria bacterium]|nr:F0F1 ATP synthase subunit delta [Gammaproteobacteria bacterium]
MEERSTLARPYAIAIFKLARQEDQYGLWSEMLQFLAMCVVEPAVSALIADPRVDKRRVAEFVIDVGGGRLNDHARNLVRVLVQNDRLDLCNEISLLYERERAKAEKREKVEVVSAYAVNPKFKNMIAEAMHKRLGCEVDLETRIDRTLIGGVIIRAGDLVIDASLKGRFRQLEVALA